MLKRLLEQKKIKRKGPKRRKTLRPNNNSDIKKIIKEVKEENEKNKKENKNNDKNLDNSKRESILLNYKDKKNINHARQSFNITKYEHQKIKSIFDDTEINSGYLLNEIKNINNNISNYISDANYVCLPKNKSPKK